MAYSREVLEHYDNPRNVGTLDKNDPDVGTGLVGAPACGDVMRLQIRVEQKWRCENCGKIYEPGEKTPDPTVIAAGLGASYFQGLGEVACCENTRVKCVEVIVDAKFKTFGCGSAIASSSLVTEWVRGVTLDEAQKIKNSQIVEELSLPPVKIHCSVLAEDAIKAAIDDWKKKRGPPKEQATVKKLPLPEDTPT